MLGPSRRIGHERHCRHCRYCRYCRYRSIGTHVSAEQTEALAREHVGKQVLLDRGGIRLQAMDLTRTWEQVTLVMPAALHAPSSRRAHTAIGSSGEAGLSRALRHHRVNASRRRHVLRHRECKVAIADCDVGKQNRRHHSFLLTLARRDDRDRRHLRARPGRRWHLDEWQAGPLAHVDAPHVVDRLRCITTEEPAIGNRRSQSTRTSGARS